MTSVISIIVSLAVIGLSINCVILTRWLVRLDRRVLDLEYPLQAEAKRRLKA